MTAGARFLVGVVNGSDKQRDVKKNGTWSPMKLSMGNKCYKFVLMRLTDNRPSCKSLIFATPLLNHNPTAGLLS
jgi:hypothetical protein